MFNNFGFITWATNWVNFVSHECLTDFIISWPWGFLLILSFKSQCRWFKDWIWSWDLQNFNVLSLAWDNNFLSIGLDINIVCSDTGVLIFMFAKSSKFWFHTSKRYKSFGKFGLFLRDEFIRAWTGVELFLCFCFTLTSENKSHLY